MWKNHTHTPTHNMSAIVEILRREQEFLGKTTENQVDIGETSEDKCSKFFVDLWVNNCRISLDIEHRPQLQHTQLWKLIPPSLCFPLYHLRITFGLWNQKQLSKFATRLIGSIVLTLSWTIAIKVCTTCIPCTTCPPSDGLWWLATWKWFKVLFQLQVEYF